MFDTMGLDSLIIDLDAIREIDDDTWNRMLEAGGEIIRKAHEEKIRELFASHTGHLAGSPFVHKKRSGNKRYVLIYPKGTHHAYRAKSGTYTKMNWGRAGKTKTKGGGSVRATNQDVAFVHEFGGHGNYPSQWMRAANEQHASEAVDAMEAVYNEFLSKHNL